MSRTSESEIQVLVNFYRMFHPTEISFVMDLHYRLSKIDPNRNKFITDRLQQVFNSHQQESDVRALISFFSNQNNKPQIKHIVNLDELLSNYAQANPISPFTEQCPVCRNILNSDYVSMKNVTIYKDNGQVVSGMILKN